MIIGLMLMACTDNDSFSTSYNNLLTFGQDTISLDTVFSNVPSPHKQFMVYNNSGDGIRITNARLEAGNQSGFRVNVNGTYLSSVVGYQVSDMELRKGDSLRVFVETTTNIQNSNKPELVEDNLVFTLENGRKQRVNLRAMSWDAIMLRDVIVSTDSTIENKDGKPVVVYGTIKVNKEATLTLAPGTTIYFDHGAGINVYGTLKSKGEKDKEVTLRSNRLDRMVSNLTYDNNPGQWGSIHLMSSAHDNEISYTDIHAATNGIVCDSALDKSKQTLAIDHSTIHNVKANGLKATACNIKMENCQVSNALDSCVAFLGGNVEINHCTIAQYYPFDANRGPAFAFANAKDKVEYPLTLHVRNSIIKGYADDVVYWSYGGIATDKAMDVSFHNSLVRTPMPTDKDAVYFAEAKLEDVKDTLTNGRNSFQLFDTQYFFYDFTPKPNTQAIGNADKLTALPDDRKGKARHSERPDLGCFETEK